MNTYATTSYEHTTRTHRRRTCPPPTSRPSPNLSILVVVLPILVLATLTSVSRAASTDSALTLNLPHVPTTCETLNLTWTGGTANYTLRVAQPQSSVPLATWNALNNTSLLWQANACGGTDVSLTLSDAGGYRSAVSFSVQRGSDGSCLSASQLAVVGCVLSASATTSTTASAQGTTSTGGSKATGPRLAVVVGIVVGVGVFVMLLVSCLYMRKRRRRGAGVLGPGLGFDADVARMGARSNRVGSRPYFVRHERDRARRRDTLLEMPPPVYSDRDTNTAEERLAGHASDASPSPPLSVADHEQARPLMPEAVQMAQLPRGRIEPELLPTPFVSPYERSAATASSEVHARGQTGASHFTGAGPQVSSGGGEVHDAGGGADEPPPPYTLTA